MTAKEVDFGGIPADGDRAPRPERMTEAQLRVEQSVIELAMARSRAMIAVEQAKIAQMEADYHELVLKFKTQPPAE